MSSAKENSCRKFQANFFNKSKCQNCFKPRELHLLTDQDLTQAKPIYGGWLCLAPEGTDFDNPMQRSRKWQRRFFVLYEHGCLRFALDESPSTLPQGTVNMNLCSDVIDAEPKTGQKNSLCIITPEQEYFIRGENKEIINGWSEQLVVYPRTNKQNQKKKRKVEPTTSQEPGPAKVAVTGSGIPEAEKVPDSSSIIWQEELNQREAEAVAVWASAEGQSGSVLPPTGERPAAGRSSDGGSVNGDEVDQANLILHASAAPLHQQHPPGDLLSPTGSCSSLGGVPRCLSPAPSDPFPSGSSLLSNGSHISGSVSSLDSDASGSTATSTDSHPASQRGGHAHSHHDAPRSRRLEAEARKAEKRGRFRSPERRHRDGVLSPERSRSGVIEKLEALELENQEKMEVEEAGRGGGGGGGGGGRQGRSELRRFHREEQRRDHAEGLDFPSTLPPLRRAKSLDRRTTESVMTPDLLNFKKGWMVKLDDQGQWTKFWFVLTDHSLRYYKDSIAEEASDLDGEIDLSTCYSVSEYQAQRNYGFKIYTQEGVHALSAMTAGIRRNWIQAVMKNVRPSNAPDVASSTEDHASFPLLEVLTRPDVTQDSPSSEASSVEREPTVGVTKSRARERRREGRSKTFDWAEFRPIAQALAQQRAQEAETLQGDLGGEVERTRRREERRKRYETVTSTDRSDLISVREAGRTEVGGLSEPGGPEGDPQGAPQEQKQQKVEEMIEQHWRQVEKTPIRDERRVPLPGPGQSREGGELEQLLDHYRQGMEELKVQLGSCHQQLLDSNKHKQELEFQLRSALDREQDVRSGYISPLEPPMGAEGDATPQMKRPELVSPQAQSLTKKYQETKELLKLQELKKRNMQAQLGLSLSHMLPAKDAYLSEPQKPPSPLPPSPPPPEPVQKSVSVVLRDSPEVIQEVEELLSGQHLSLTELLAALQSHSRAEETSERHRLHHLLETWRLQQEVENDTIKKSLARAGESIRQYEARLLTMEDLLGSVQKQSLESLQSPHHPETMVGVLSQRVELLTNENGALKQRCQEIMNQLTEADREIDRLKAELMKQQSREQHLLALEELKRVKAQLAQNQATAVERERELNEKSLRLHEALVAVDELGNSLKETEKKLQLKEATLKGLGFSTDSEEQESQPEAEELQELLENSHRKVSEMEAKLQFMQEQCLQLEASNSQLTAANEEAQKVSRGKLEEAETEIKMLREKLETQAGGGEVTGSECVDAGARQVQEVVEEVQKKAEAIGQVVDMLEKVDISVERMLSDLKSTLSGSSTEEPLNLLNLSQYHFTSLVEAEFWCLLQGTSEITSVEHCGVRSLAENMLALKRLMFSAREICPQAKAKSDLACMYDWFDNEAVYQILQELKETLEVKRMSLKEISSRLSLYADDKLLSVAIASCQFSPGEKQPSEYLLEALKEASTSYVIIRSRVQQQKELQRTQEEVQISVDCPNCPILTGVASDFQSRVSELQGRLSEAALRGPPTMIKVEGEPIDSLDKTIKLQDLIAKHRKELGEVKDHYEQEVEKMRQEVASADEAMRLRSQENVKEVDSLSNCMEDLKRRHELETSQLVERFQQEMEELRSVVNPGAESPSAQSPTLKQRIQELVTRVSAMTEEARRREEQDDGTAHRLKYERDLENLKATCERGFAAMEDSHQKVIEELQRKHQRELENLHQEKERLLAEETAATIAAIEAMKNAHRSELERELDKARKSNSSAQNADVEEIQRQHEEELCSLHREIQVLSEQYSQKCLENAHLAQALEAERQALRQCQRENQELNAHNQELNNRLATEITKMRSMASEDGGCEGNAPIQGKELYELEVMLRVKESEVQYLKQEINSLKEELQAAQRDKKYSTDKYKDIYTELSIVRAKAERDVGRLRDQLQLAHEALGESALEEVVRGGGYDIMKSKSNPDILKMAAAKRSERTLRSKSLKEGLTPEQRLHLFENKDTKEF